MTANRMGRLLVLLLALLPLPACVRHCIPVTAEGPRQLIDLCRSPEGHAPVHPGVTREVAAEFRRRIAAQQPSSRPYHCLALSGGGLHGAFGVGVLKGWTESGSRPKFDVVTGISTGALISTFAFLGPEYDDTLKENLVGIRSQDILRRRPLLLIPFLGSVYSSRPLARQIRREITPEILAQVAQAHGEGRRLYVGTTTLDTRQLVIWDMGEIASRGTPEALKLYRDIILASSSVPGAAPPVRLRVEVDGKLHDELHADGGVSDEVIFRTFMIADLNRNAGLPGSAAPPGSTLHVVVNGKLYADPSCVRPGYFDLLSTSLESIVYGKTRDELYRIYLNCLETGIEFRLTAVRQDLKIEAGALSLSPADQRVLYAEGRQVGQGVVSGFGWDDMPPDIASEEQGLVRSSTRYATGDRKTPRSCGGNCAPATDRRTIAP